MSPELWLGVAISLASSACSNVGLLVMKKQVSLQDARVVATASPSFAMVGEAVPSAPSNHSASLNGGETHIARGFDAARKRKVRRRSFSESVVEDLQGTQEASAALLNDLGSCSWLIGLFVFTIGQTLNLVALSYLDEVIWAVLSLFSLVSNAFFSSIILGEKLHSSDLASTAFVIFGSAMVVISSSNPAKNSSAPDANADSDPHVVFKQFGKPLFLSYCALLGVLLVGLIVHGVRQITHGLQIHALTWTILSAVCGAVSATLGKATVELVGIYFRGTGNVATKSQVAAAHFALVAPQSYVVAAVFLCAAISALVTLNMALAVGEALLVVPILTVCNTFLSILAGMFYFGELNYLLSLERTFIFVAGVTIALYGSVRLQQGRESTVDIVLADDVRGSEIILRRVKASGSLEPLQENFGEEETGRLVVPTIHSPSSYGT